MSASKRLIDMALRKIWAILPLLASLLAAATGDSESAQRKFDLIESDSLAAGSRVVFSMAEIAAAAGRQLPDGVRQPRIGITAEGAVSASASVDFGALRRSEGHPPGWLMSKLLDGEHPVSVTAHIWSGDGQARVDVDRVEIAGVEIDGATLDFLIRYVLLPLYPDAAVGRPFALSHRVERIETGPRAVTVVIGP